MYRVAAGPVASVVVFPFATPETVAWLGLERSRSLARVGGFLLVAIALWMGWMTLSDPCFQHSSWSQDCRSKR